MNQGFIDIHCHILPGMDDGAGDMEESLQMLRIARDDGIAGIVATPHIMSGVYDNTRETIGDAISRLASETDLLPLYIGADIRLGRETLQGIINRDYPPINDKKYVLLELPTYMLPPVSELGKIIYSLKVRGIVPVITHPERNLPILEDLTILESLVRQGAVSQVTAMSLTGKLGRRIQKAAFTMIREGHAHVVASDAHDTRQRPPLLSGACRKIHEKFGEKVAYRLFVENPLNIIQGRDVVQV